MARVSTQADFLALLEKLYPPEKMTTLAPEFLAGFAALGERLATASENWSNATTAGRASFGSYASGSLEVLRSQSGLAITFPIGSQFWDRHGQVVKLLDAIILPSGSLGPVSGSWISISQSYQANIYSGSVLAPVTSFSDYNIYARIISSGGGVSPDLESLGHQKDIAPVSGESDAAFRKRLRSLNEVVTPETIEAIVHKYYPTGYVTESFEMAGPATADFATIDTPNGEGFFFTDYPTEAEYIPEAVLARNMFVVHIPPPSQTEQELLWLYADYGHSDYQDCYAALEYPGVDENGNAYDIGQPNAPAATLAMCKEINQKKAAGVEWFIIEDVV